MSATQVLDTCQALYERHKLITYPRSDCRFLPVEHFTQAKSVLSAIAKSSQELANAVHQSNPQIKSKAWNDGKIQAHHAIIPTEKAIDLHKLSKTEKNIYQHIARQYIAQFYPHCEILESEIKLTIAGGEFIAKAKEITSPGWKTLFDKKTTQNIATPDNASANINDNDTALNIRLPIVHKGESLTCKQGELVEKQTTPPKPFDDASLLSAMTGIARYVHDAQLRKVLKETDGLGTEATRAGIIELLFKRNFLARSGKKIIATPAGRALINNLPERTTTPDMTAQWEMQLDDISNRNADYASFMLPLCDSLKALISESEQHLPHGLKNLESKRTVRKGRKTHRKKK